MKYNKFFRLLFGATLITSFVSCDDFLERAPLSSITPEVFFYQESDLAAYSANKYDAIFPGDGASSTYLGDANTDNQVSDRAGTNLFVPGNKKVGAGTDNWNFDQIRYCNYFLDIVIPRWKTGEISGIPENIDHYIGEVYFMRALEYFSKVKSVGDYPIIRHVLTDNFEILQKANERKPRNEVMRFVISDLDSAIVLMNNTPPGGKNRLTKNAALLLKSRAALYEGSFLKYFKGTAYVPNGTGWPGATKEYNKGYQYPLGDIDQEINWFLEQAIDAAQKVASVTTLTQNSKNPDEVGNISTNPYFVLFNETEGFENYSEVIFWKDYNAEEKVAHTNQSIQIGGLGSGLTRGFVDNFVMTNGLPVYAPNSGYHGDADFTSFRADRDWRLQLFVRVKGDYSIKTVDNKYTAPHILDTWSSGGDFTGYSASKYMDYTVWPAGATNENDYAIYRAAEAYLNYIEAYYLRHGSLDNNCDTYWRAIRNRAGINPDYQVTINATQMEKEALCDWGAYSAGVLIDPTLYNIRRERRCEFVSEGMRFDDLVRWRAMDQLITTPYHIEGFNLWAGNYDDSFYKTAAGDSKLKYIGDEDGTTNGNVSSPTLSTYLRPFQKSLSFELYNGIKWHSAHYLNPIGANNFLLTSTDGITIEQSPIYQNPGWTTKPNSSPVVVDGF